MNFDDIEEFQKRFPFMTCLRYGGEDFLGIVLNADEKVVTFYDLGSILCKDQRNLFIELGEIWWWESNRSIPINIFMRGQMEIFRNSLRTANMKDVEVLFGPMTSLNNIIQKRIKRRQIQLVKKL